MINLIEKKQIFLLKKAKSYLKNLKKKGIDVSKSSLCYLSTYSKTPGFAKIVLWLKEKNYTWEGLKYLLLSFKTFGASNIVEIIVGITISAKALSIKLIAISIDIVDANTIIIT